MIEVSGRTLSCRNPLSPFEVPVVGRTDDPDDPTTIVRTELRDQTEAIIDAVAELEAEPPGDVLGVPVRGTRSATLPEVLRGAVDSP